MTRLRSPAARFAAELLAMTSLGVAFVLGVLWFLNAMFPQATGLGNLATSRRERAAQVGSRSDSADSANFATLSAVQRDVRDKPGASVVWSAAKRGTPISDGHAIQSYEGASATITFDDRSVVEIGQKSVVVFKRPRVEASTGRRRAAILFMDGFLRGRIGRGAGDDLDVEVLAGGGVVRPHESGKGIVELALAVDKNASTLAVREGKADVVWNGKTTVVPGGYMVTFDADRPPGRPEALPQPVTLESPEGGARYLHRGAPPSVTFSWNPRDDTREFEVQIARDARFSDVLQTLRRSSTRFTHGNLGDGEYYWRVIGLRGSVEGGPSESGRFTIARHDRPPALAVEFPQGVVTQESIVLRGSTEPGCRVVIGDAGVPTDATGRFEHQLEMRDGYNFLVVQSIDPTGNTAFSSHTVVAKLGTAKEPR